MDGFASAVITVLAIVSASYVRFLVDEVFVVGSRFTVHALTAAIMALALLQILLGLVRSKMLLVFAVKMDLSFVVTLWKHLMRLPLSFFESRRTGEVLSRLSDTEHVEDALSDASFTIIFDTLMVAAVGVALAVRNLRLFLIAILTVPLSSAVVWAFAGTFRRMYERILALEDREEATMVETIHAITAIKASVGEAAALRRVEERIVGSTLADYKAEKIGLTRSMLVRVLDSWRATAFFG